jgi:radical SAM protein with 4Fe4S-binding SPASM domain
MDHRGGPLSLVRSAVAAARLARANLVRLERPLKVNLALTYWCQYKCKTCNIWQRRPIDELSTAEVLRFIERNRDFSWADLTGGEIFLREDVNEIFDAITSSWRDLVILHFPTNGFLTAKIVAAAQRLTRRGIPHVIVTVSLDGDEQLNDDVRGIKGGFNRQMETFAALHQMDGIQTVLGMTLSRYNAGQVERTFAACQQRYPRLTWNDFHVNLAQVSEHYYGNTANEPVAAPRETALRELGLYRSRRAGLPSLSGWIERAYLGRLERFLETGVTPMRCHALRSSCFVDPWGTVFPCISYTRPMGRLRDTGMRLEPIWRDAATAAVQREIWQGDCPQCWTACEAYQSILGNIIRPFDHGPRLKRTLPLIPVRALVDDKPRRP